MTTPETMTRRHALGMIPGISAAVVAGGAVLRPQQASAATESIGNRILDTAETRTGCWYEYGAAGPSYFDCSGLVYWAAHRLGYTWMPRTTEEMLGSWHLYRVYSPQRGDLAFWGTGHVEMVTVWYHTTFGAQHTGTRVGWHKWYPGYGPTTYHRLR